MKKDNELEVNSLVQGLTLRDYFAAMALSGFAADGSSNGEFVASVAYMWADEMLKERAKK